jgi:hypothetical protein
MKDPEQAWLQNRSDWAKRPFDNKMSAFKQKQFRISKKKERRAISYQISYLLVMGIKSRIAF